MNRLTVLTGLLAAAVVLTGASLRAEEKDDKFDIGDFMKKAHAKAGSYKAKIQAAIKDKNWDDAAKEAKEWFANAQKLTKANPPKGEKKSWDKLSLTYCKTVKTLSEATEKKEAAKANGAIGQINKSCGACHKAHKP